MSSIHSQFGQRTYVPTIYDYDAGLAFGSGDDFLSPRNIGNIGSGYVRTVSPTRSNNPYTYIFNDPLSHNANSLEVLLRTTDFTSGVRPPSGGSPGHLFNLPYEPYSYYQGVPRLGTNPDSISVLSATTQFQNELVTVGPRALPGYPQVDFFNSQSQALDFMGHTTSFINAIVPFQPNATSGGVVFPGNNGNVYYPPPSIQPPYNYGPYQPYNYPYFNPGWGICNPGMGIPYPVPRPNPQPYPQPQPTSALQLAAAIRSSATQLPGFIPKSVQGGVNRFLSTFNQLSESDRVEIRQEWVNPTVVDEAVLNTTGITSTGGLYKQGKVTNPFLQAGFLTDTNPFETYDSGIVVTNGNENGKVKGTTEADLLLGTVDRNNIFDGRGGEDTVIGSTKNDLVNVYHGDQVMTDAGDDLMFYDFTRQPYEATRVTAVNGGSGNDTMVLTVDGNPSLESDSPRFRQLGEGVISVTINGIQLIAQNIEKFIVTDTSGNIGGTYKVTTTPSA